MLNTAFSFLIAIHNFLNQAVIVWLCQLTVCIVILYRSRLLQLLVDLLCPLTLFQSQSHRSDIDRSSTLHWSVGPWQILSTSLSIDLQLGLTTHRSSFAKKITPNNTIQCKDDKYCLRGPFCASSLVMSCDAKFYARNWHVLDRMSLRYPKQDNCGTHQWC